MKSPFLKEDVPLLKVYVLTKKALKYMKQNLIQLKGEIVKSTVKAEFNTSLSVIDRPSRQIINKDTTDLNNTISQLDLITIYRTLYLIKEQNTYSFQRICTWNTYQYRPYSQHKASVYKFKNDQVIQIMFSDYSGIKLEIGNVKVS